MAGCHAFYSYSTPNSIPIPECTRAECYTLSTNLIPIRTYNSADCNQVADYHTPSTMQPNCWYSYFNTQPYFDSRIRPSRRLNTRLAHCYTLGKVREHTTEQHWIRQSSRMQPSTNATEQSIPTKPFET